MAQEEREQERETLDKNTYANAILICKSLYIKSHGVAGYLLVYCLIPHHHIKHDKLVNKLFHFPKCALVKSTIKTTMKNIEVKKC